MQSEWPLCGRDAELRRFQKILAGVEYRAVVVAGDAGVGKTFFARHCLRAAAEAGYATTEVTGTNSVSGLPFGAFAHLLPAFDPAPAGLVDRHADLLRRLSARLTERSPGRRLLVFVDDAHLLDDASAALVWHLVSHDLAFVLLTIRSGAPAPDAVTGLWKDQHAERLDLRGLGDDAVAGLLPAVLGGPVDPAVVATLTTRSVGNMLFLSELVAGALSSATLREDRGMWRLAKPLTPPEPLVELIRLRLEALNERERDLLQVLSFGEPLGPGELLGLTHQATVTALERKHLLRTTSDGRRLEFRLAHPLYGDVIRAATGPARARTIAADLANAVEMTGARRREDAMRIATWRLEAGGGSAELMLDAAKKARWHYDFALSERLARAAVATGEAFEARLLLAELASLQGRTDEAEILFADMAECAADDGQRAMVACLQVDTLAIFQGKLSEALRVAHAAERTIVDPEARASVRAKRATAVLGVEGPRGAAELVESLVPHARGNALVWTCAIGAYALSRTGQIEQALSFTERGLAAHQTLTGPSDSYPWIHPFFRCEALGCAGRFDEAEKVAMAEHHSALLERSVQAQASFAFQLARLALRRGDMPVAVQRSREAMAVWGALGRDPYTHLCEAILTFALASLGRPTEASDEATTSVPPAPGTAPTVWLYGVDSLEAQAWAQAVRGERTKAFETLAEGRELARASGDRFGEATVLSAYARLGRAGEVHVRLDELAHLVEGALVPALAAHAAGVAHEDGPGLDRLSEQFELMGAYLLAAECSAESRAVWLRRGDDQAGLAAERRVTALLTHCDATTPALSGFGHRTRLTPVERQICLLAQEGRSNNAIAEELAVSKRSVENHLHRAYHKLGVTNRHDLALALGGSHPDAAAAANRP